MKSSQSTYKTVLKPGKEILFKDKNSKFFGKVFPINSPEDVTQHLENLKAKHAKAGHFCYAWQVGKEENEIQYQTNDDGEPGNSAGKPIYGQIQAFEVTGVLVVVLRYFGGVKLGMGGLIKAYKTSAQMALEAAEIRERTIDLFFEISFNYPEMNKVMRIVKASNLKILDQQLEISCKILISVPKDEVGEVHKKFKSLHPVKIKKIGD